MPDGAGAEVELTTVLLPARASMLFRPTTPTSATANRNFEVMMSVSLLIALRQHADRAMAAACYLARGVSARGTSGWRGIRCEEDGRGGCRSAKRHRHRRTSARAWARGGGG